MKKMPLRIIPFLFLLLANTISYSQNSYHFRTFSPKGGFYYDGVQSIIQDDDGFVWILLENDLQRFDGYEYKRYSSDFQNPDMPSLSNIIKDTAGILYVSTSHGVFRYKKQTDSFEKYIEEAVTTLTIDDKNNLWCVRKGQLNRFKLDENIFELCENKKQPINGISLCGVADQGVYFASRSNSIFYSANDNPLDLTRFMNLPAGYRIAGIAYKKNALWVLTEKQGVLKIDIATKNIEAQWKFRDDAENAPLNAFYVDKRDKLWIGTQLGLYLLNPMTGKSQQYLHSKMNIFSLPNNSVWTIVGDSQDNIWIGTFAGGLCYVNLNDRLQFKTYNIDVSGLSYNLVSSFAEDGNILWIGTEGGGLNSLNKITGEFKVYKSGGGSNSLAYNNIKSLALDFRGRLWISMFRGGLDCFDTKTKTFRHFQNDPNDKESLYGNNLRKIILEDDEGLWVAYQANRSLISFFSFQNEKFSHYQFDDDNGYIYDIHKDQNGDLWIASNKYLYKMDKANMVVTNVSAQKIEVLNARSVCTDANGNVWIGTIGRGLVKYDVATSTFTSYADLQQFNVYTINSICVDFANCLWLGTNNGLFSYDIQKNSYRRFDESDGLQGNVYYPLASLNGSSRNFYFGGTNGFTIIDARTISDNKLKPKAIISDFYINNVSVSPKFVKKSADDEIILNHNQINFGFTFSSDNYLLPGKNRFKYRLRGYDDRWVTTDALNRTVMYSKIPSGIYYFEVLAANNDGVWNDVPTILKIRRKPAPWSSWWAYLLYSIAAVGMLAILLTTYFNHRKLKMQHYIDDLNKQKQDELHKSQLSFFTNISHDFKTPLSLILATLANLKQDGVKEYYYNVLNNNAQRLLNLVNELMDFRTIENGKMTLKVQLSNVNLMISEFSSDFMDYALDRNIIFDTRCDPELLKTLYVDRIVMEKVIMNLLNNSFKYTSNGGHVTIATYSNYSKYKSAYNIGYKVPDVEVPEDYFVIAVRDSGVGISEESIGTIFERYYKVDSANMNTHLGTGIGLALVKSLVLLHKGIICVNSERFKGTDIAVCFPTSALAYDKSEFLKIDETKELETDSKIIVQPDEIEEEILLNEKKRILIVEDNQDLSILLSDFLSPHFEVFEAANGVEATEFLQEADADLILSDIMMPLKDGITLCREVKSDINTSHIPFILLTAKTGLEAKIDGADSGADIYFEKPIDFNLLLLTINNIFKSRQTLRDYYAKNYFIESAELSANEKDNVFLKKVIEIMDENIHRSDIDIAYISSELSMSQSKFYSKLKMLTGKTPVQFILNYKLRKAARILIEQDLSMSQVMDQIGIKSLSYFTSAFKKEFGETPSAFAASRKKKN